MRNRNNFYKTCLSVVCACCAVSSMTNIVGSAYESSTSSAESVFETSSGFENCFMYKLLEAEEVSKEEMKSIASDSQTSVKGVSDSGAQISVGLTSNQFSTTLDDYNGVVVAKSIEERKRKEEEERKRKEEEERKKQEEEERKRKEAEELERKKEEAKQRAIEEAYRIAAETGENVPNYDPNCHSWVKTYMGYQAVTCKSSYQYYLLNSQYAYTDPETGLRMIDDSGDGTDPRYCIALGTFYSVTIGQKIDLVLEDGTVVPCVLGDVKADIHTNDTNQYGAVNGDVAEFIIDDTVYYTKYDNSGTVNWVDGLAGSIYCIIIWDDYVWY